MTDEAKALVERLGQAKNNHVLCCQAIAMINRQAREIERLWGALKPFAFREMEKDEGLADTQYVWETIHSDRVQDWFSYEEIEAARAALGDSHD